MDLGYPFTQEGSTIVVQRALGQNNIDDLLKLSEDYNKGKSTVPRLGGLTTVECG
jgi:hypothetical protein